MNRTTTKIRPPAAALRLLLAVVLAVGLAPLPAFTGQAAADDLAAATLGAQEAPSRNAISVESINRDSVSGKSLVTFKVDLAQGCVGCGFVATLGGQKASSVADTSFPYVDWASDDAQANFGTDVDYSSVLNPGSYTVVLEYPGSDSSDVAYPNSSEFSWLQIGAEDDPKPFDELRGYSGDDPQPGADPVKAGNADFGGVNCAWSYGGNIASAEGTGYTVTPYTADGVTYVIDTIVVDGTAVELTAEQQAQPYTVASANSSVFATFAYVVNFNSPDNGTLSVARADGTILKSGDVVRGGEVLTITATPADGYEMDGEMALTGLSSVDASAGTYRVTAQNGEPTPAIAVKYKEIPAPTFSATVASGIQNGDVTLSAPAGKELSALAQGDAVTVAATPAEGYGVGSVWCYTTDASSKTTIEQSDGAYRFAMPAADVTVGADFAELAPEVPQGAEAAWYVGYPDATSVKAVLYLDGTLRFEGAGDMAKMNGSGAAPWYGSRDKVRSVQFADGVAPTDLGDYFSGCANLEQVQDLPASVRSMTYAFSGCAKLGAAPALPDGLEGMDGAFCGCSSLAEAGAIPDGVKSMAYAFSGAGLTSAPLLPAGVENLASAFARCESLAALPEGFFVPEGAATDRMFELGAPHSADDPLPTSCFASDYAALSALPWSSWGRNLAYGHEPFTVSVALGSGASAGDASLLRQEGVEGAMAPVTVVPATGLTVGEPAVEPAGSGLVVEGDKYNGWRVSGVPSADVAVTFPDAVPKADHGEVVHGPFAAGYINNSGGGAFRVMGSVYQDGTLRFECADGVDAHSVIQIAKNVNGNRHTNWWEYVDEVKAVEFGEGVTLYGDPHYYFANFASLEEMPGLPGNPTSLDGFLYGCASLTEIPEGWALPESAASYENFMYVGEPYSAESPLPTYCADADYERLSALPWADWNRVLVSDGERKAEAARSAIDALEADASGAYDGAAVEAALGSFNDLTDEQKAKLPAATVAKLLAAQQQVAAAKLDRATSDAAAAEESRLKAVSDAVAAQAKAAELQKQVEAAQAAQKQAEQRAASAQAAQRTAEAKAAEAEKRAAAAAAAQPAAKKANTMTAKGKTVTVKLSKAKKKAQTLKASKAFTVKEAQGKVTYKVAKWGKNAKKYLKVASNGKVTVKKGAKKGTYTVKVKVTAAGNANYKAKSKTVTLKVRVR